MNPRRDEVAHNLADAVSRLDAVLNPWNLEFFTQDVQFSHCGPFASGHYCRNKTRIGISCRDTIDNIYYEHTFVTRNGNAIESEKFTIGHAILMDALGYSSECCLIVSDGIPNAISGRDGSDPIDALIHDLSELASSVLQEPCDEFYSIVRRGFRSYSIG